ncbi:unnamed protein product [Cylindrotheca closterium]|uniref:HD/PDEase domain-containing protein n=1 Tax=Cylindrotheca closterium TaxID=2856 RepID=A0AAD2CS41_9STRA|nr:unnamed protein product [Cylindrotheca closterium]
MTNLIPQHAEILTKAVELVQAFYLDHPEIKVSHGWKHVHAVWKHTQQALISYFHNDENINENDSRSSWSSSKISIEIQLASLLHDLDDRKYFPKPKITRLLPNKYSNAAALLEQLGIEVIEGLPVGGSGNDTLIKNYSDRISGHIILQMISWVSCSENGNLVPKLVQETGAYHLLIPRWADRLEAVGARGVVRCYQYNKEQQSAPLFSDQSPRPKNEQELWFLLQSNPNRLHDYMDRGGTSTDMISHYYDKLLPVAKPPKSIVRNQYLETQADLGAKHLVEVCVRFGKSGTVDKDYMDQLAMTLG